MGYHMVSRRLASTRLAAVIVTLTMAAACTSSGEGSGGPVGNGTGKPCVVAAAGDVAGENDYRRGAARTAELISSAAPRKVLALGDLAYSEGTVAEFADYYDPTWGSLKPITAPTPGNHEYESDGKGYFDYFGVAPNYAFDLCGWRIVSVDQYAGMGTAVAFIEDEGRSAGATPLLVFWHEPRFSSGTEHGSNPELQPLWEAAVAAGADIVLNGHDHDYERLEPLDANGKPGSGGTVEFVSGNGGHDLRGVGNREAHSAAAIAGTPGVLFLTLRADGYDWSYRDVEGRTGDSGTRELR
jgi:calcineurin-like phosphoesterase family protein